MLKAIVFIWALTVFTAVALADDVYNFQFRKSEAAAAPSTKVAAELASATKDQTPERGWVGGVGGGDHVQTYSYGFTGWHGYVGYQFSKFVGLEAQAIFGKGNVYDNDDHFVIAAGGRLTPIHIRLFDWDLIDVSGLAGVLTGVSQTDISRAKLSPYVGYDVALNLATRFAFILSAKLEGGDSAYHQITYTGVYRF